MKPAGKIARRRRRVRGNDVPLHEDPVGVIVDQNDVGAELFGGNLAQDLRSQRFAGGAGVLGFDERITPSKRLREFIELRSKRGPIDDQLTLVLCFGREVLLRARQRNGPCQKCYQKCCECWKSGSHEISPSSPHRLRRGRKIKRDGVLRESYFGYSPIDADVSTFTLRYQCFGIDCRRRAIREIFVFACQRVSNTILKGAK